MLLADCSLQKLPALVRKAKRGVLVYTKRLVGAKNKIDAGDSDGKIDSGHVEHVELAPCERASYAS